MSCRGTQTQERKIEMAKIMTIRVVLGILAMMLLVPLAMPDSALARPILKINSVKPTCDTIEPRIAELEGKEKKGTITKKEAVELRNLREIHDYLVCGVKDLIGTLAFKGDDGVDPNVGSDSKDDGCTWENLWCVLAPVVEVAQTIASPDPGPTNPPPEPLPPLDPRPEPPDPLPPAPVPLSELSEEGSGDPDSSGSADVDAIAQNNDTSTPQPETATDLKKLGYKCERAGVGSFICSKKGAPDYICDLDGRCARIKITNPNPTWGLPKSPTNAGVASPREVQGNASSDQYSSGEGTEILVDPGVEPSEGSTIENIR